MTIKLKVRNNRKSKRHFIKEWKKYRKKHFIKNKTKLDDKFYDKIMIFIADNCHLIECDEKKLIVDKLTEKGR